MSSSVLQDLLKDHNSEIGDWSEIVNSHQEDASAIESLRARQATYDINQDGPFYIFVSQLHCAEPTHHPHDRRLLQNEIYDFFEGPKNLFHVHVFKTRGCCMLRVKNFESCIKILRRDGENYKDKPIKVEYVVKNVDQPADQPINYSRFTSIQLDAQMEMFQQKQKAKPPKPNPFGDAKPADISKKMEEVALKVQAEQIDKKPPPPQQPKPVETITTHVGRTTRVFERTVRQQHPQKSDSFRDNRTPRGGFGGGGGGGRDHYHHHKYQGQNKNYHPRILSHRSNDGEQHTTITSSSKGSNYSNNEMVKDNNKGNNNNFKIIGENNTKITTSTTGSTTATTSNTTNGGGSTITTKSSNTTNNTISTAIQQQQKTLKMFEKEEKNLKEKGKVEVVEQQGVKVVEHHQHQQKIFFEEKSVEIEEEKNVIVSNTTTTNLEKKNKQKAKNKKKQNKNQGGYTQNRFMPLKDHSDFDA